MSPSVTLALRAHYERKQAECAAELAKRDLEAATWGLKDAEEDLARIRDQEAFLSRALNDYEQAELLLAYIAKGSHAPLRTSPCTFSVLSGFGNRTDRPIRCHECESQRTDALSWHSAGSVPSWRQSSSIGNRWTSTGSACSALPCRSKCASRRCPLSHPNRQTHPGRPHRCI